MVELITPVLPVIVILPTLITSILLFESTNNAADAVNVPGTCFRKSVKYLPPMAIGVDVASDAQYQ